MPIVLDHLIVPSHDKAAGARLLGELLGVAWEPGSAETEFAPVYVNETLTLDFAQREQFASHHYCFHVSDDEFDAIHERIVARDIIYRDRPRGVNNNQINTRLGGKNLYWEDSDGHVWEMLTVSYARPRAALAL